VADDRSALDRVLTPKKVTIEVSLVDSVLVLRSSVAGSNSVGLSGHSFLPLFVNGKSVN